MESQEDDKKAQLASGRLRLSKLPNATWRVLCVLKSLQRLVPAARAYYDDRPGGSPSQNELRQALVALCPEGMAGYDRVAEDPFDYLQRLLEWGAPPGAELPRCIEPGSGGRAGVADLRALHAAGCYPHAWPVPLTRAGVQAANEQEAAEAAEDSEAVLRKAVRLGMNSYSPASPAGASSATPARAGGSAAGGSTAGGCWTPLTSGKSPAAVAQPQRGQQGTDPAAELQQDRAAAAAPKPTPEQPQQGAAAVAAPAAGGPAAAEQEEEDSEQAVAAKEHAAASGAAAEKPQPRRPAGKQPAVTAAAAADSRSQAASAEVKGPSAKWAEVDGWWMRDLPKSALNKNCRLACEAAAFELLAGRKAENLDELAVEDAGSSQGYSFPYRRDEAARAAYLNVSKWGREMGASAGDYIAFQRHGSRLLVKLIPKAEARRLLAAASAPVAAATGREQATTPGPAAVEEREQGVATGSAAGGSSKGRGAGGAANGAEPGPRPTGKKRQRGSDAAEAPAQAAPEGGPLPAATGATGAGAAALAAPGAMPASPYVGAYALSDDTEAQPAAAAAAGGATAADGQAVGGQEARRAAHGRARRPGSAEAASTQPPALAATELEPARVAAAVGDPGASPTGDALVGCRIEVYWDGDKQWYRGLVKFFNRRTGRHHVHYDDGDKRKELLAAVRWRLLEPRPAEPAGGEGAQPRPEPGEQEPTGPLQPQQDQQQGQLEGHAAVQLGRRGRAARDRAKAPPLPLQDHQQEGAAAAVQPAEQADAVAAQEAALPPERQRRRPAQGEPGAGAAPAEQVQAGPEQAGPAGSGQRQRKRPRSKAQLVEGQQVEAAANAEPATEEQQAEALEALQVVAPPPAGAESDAEHAEQAGGPAKRGRPKQQRQQRQQAARKEVTAIEGAAEQAQAGAAVSRAAQQQAKPPREHAELKRLREAGVDVQLHGGRSRRRAALLAAADVRAGLQAEASDGSPPGKRTADEAAAAGSPAEWVPGAFELALESHPMERQQRRRQQEQQPSAVADAPASTVAAVPSLPPSEQAAAPEAAAPQRRGQRRVRQRQQDAGGAGTSAAAAAAAAAAAVAGAAPRPASRQRAQRPQQQVFAIQAAPVTAAAPEEEALASCYWFDRPEKYQMKLSRKAREQRADFEAQGLELTSCHDCQEPTFRYTCQSGSGCAKTYCLKCIELYRYLLDFGPRHSAALRRMRADFCRGVCPCCLRVCVRSKCRSKPLDKLGGPAPVPNFSTSQQVMFACHLADQLLPAVEGIMQLHQEEALAAGGRLEDAQLAEIGFEDGQRAPQSERALCNRCATCLEDLHFHCPRGDCDDLCPTCTRELRQCRRGAASTVHCPSCRSAMVAMRFVDGAEQAMLLQARARLERLLGGSPTAAAGPARARMLRMLCIDGEGAHPVGSGKAVAWDWVGSSDWLADLDQMEAADALSQPPPQPALQQQQRQPLPAQPAQQQRQQQSPPAEQQQQRQQQQRQQQSPPAEQQQQRQQQQRLTLAHLQRLLLAQQQQHFQQVQQVLANTQGWANGAHDPALQQLLQQLQAMQRKPVLHQPGLPAPGVPPVGTPLVPSQVQQQQWQVDQPAAQWPHQWQAQQQQGPQQLLHAVPLQHHADALAGGSDQAVGSRGRGKREVRPSAKALAARQSEEPELDEHAPGQLQGAQRWQQLPAPVPAAAPAAAAAGLPAPPEELPGEALQARQWWWKSKEFQLPEAEVRRASSRGTQDFIWTPHVEQLQPGHPDFRRSVKIFQLVWGRGEPIIVRGLCGEMGWTPEGMGRVCKELNKSKLEVIHCSDYSRTEEYTSKDFFEKYKRCCGDMVDETGEPLPMLKLKDFPPRNDFRRVMRRHYDDFVGLLNQCMPAYVHPTHGPLNLATLLPWYTKRPDLGPKGYIASGREQETAGAEGDSVTKMHEDLSDAINIMLHVQHRPGAQPGAPRHGYQTTEGMQPSYGGAGAVWDLVRREDRAKLRQFFQDYLDGKLDHHGCPKFVHSGQDVREREVHDVMHDQCFMLTSRHRELLRERYGVHTWHVEQYDHEAVFIPGGCAHQVRNLRSCIKVALDFVSPDALVECSGLREEFRRLAMQELEAFQQEAGPGAREADVASRHFADKLQVGNMVLFGWLRAMELLEKVVAGEREALPPLPPEPEEPREDPDDAGTAQQAQQQQPQEQQQAGGSSGGAALVPLAGAVWGAGEQQALAAKVGRKRGRG